jgi:hypothetical protein
MNRRDFTRITALSIPGIALLFQGCKNSSGTFEEALSLPRTLYKFIDPKEIHEIGKAYLALSPQEADKIKLTGLLLNGRNDKAKQMNPSPDQAIEMIEANIHEDFRQDRTSIIKGWILATTEARQCAFYTIIHN